MREWMTADVPGSAEGASHEGTWQTQIDLHDRPCRVHPRCGHLSLPGAPSLLGRDPPYSRSPPPRLSPPTSTHPSVRLHRTMSLCGTSGYAYPSALLWADLLINKVVGPYQKVSVTPQPSERHPEPEDLLDSPGFSMPITHPQGRWARGRREVWVGAAKHEASPASCKLTACPSARPAWRAAPG